MGLGEERDVEHQTEQVGRGGRMRDSANHVEYLGALRSYGGL